MKSTQTAPHSEDSDEHPAAPRGLSARTLFVVALAALIGGLLILRQFHVHLQATDHERLRSVCDGATSYVLSRGDRSYQRTWYEAVTGYCPQYDIVEVSVGDAKRLDSVARQILPHMRIESLDLTMLRTVQDSELVNLVTACPHVTELDLEGSCVTDAILPAIAKLPELVECNLSMTNVTGSGFAMVGQGCPNLRRLELRWSDLDANGLAQITEYCRSLSELDLSMTKINAIELLRLKDLPQLRTLRVQGVGVSADILDELRFVLPKLEIIR